MNTTRITSFEKRGKNKISCVSTEIVSGSIPREVIQSKPREAHWGEGFLSQSFYKLFFANEFLAYNKAKTKQDLIADIRELHKNNKSLIKKFANGTYTIGTFRKRYNLRKLYKAQPPLFLISFEYNDRGLIVAGGQNHKVIVSFADCVWKCKMLKVADPRFIPHDQIVGLRNKQLQNEFMDWSVPNEEDIRELRLKINENLEIDYRIRSNEQVYNSVFFDKGSTLEDTPDDFEPFIF
jgi:hypothetical protein